MKKKYRDIEVNGEEYAWAVQDGCDTCTLKIWKDKKVLIEDVDIADMTITPSMVKEIILEGAICTMYLRANQMVGRYIEDCID